VLLKSLEPDGFLIAHPVSPMTCLLRLVNSLLYSLAPDPTKDGGRTHIECKVFDISLCSPVHGPNHTCIKTPARRVTCSPAVTLHAEQCVCLHQHCTQNSTLICVHTTCRTMCYLALIPARRMTCSLCPSGKPRAMKCALPFLMP